MNSINRHPELDQPTETLIEVALGLELKIQHAEAHGSLSQGERKDRLKNLRTEIARRTR